MGDKRNHMDLRMYVWYTHTYVEVYVHTLYVHYVHTYKHVMHRDCTYVYMLCMLCTVRQDYVRKCILCTKYGLGESTYVIITVLNKP